MLDRHAGRLRSDLAERIQTSVRDYERELAFVVREAVASVEAAVERSRHEQRSGRAHVSARLEELALRERRLAELSAELSDDGDELIGSLAAGRIVSSTTRAV